MKYFNALILAGLILCGLALLTGFLLGNGSIQGLAAYFGWFLFACSALSYAVKSGGVLLRGVTAFWGTLYPVNFGLALLGLSVVGIHEERTVIVMGVVALLGAAASLVLQRGQVLKNRYAPVSMLLVLGIALVQPAVPLWKYLCVFVGVLLLVNAFVENKFGERRSAESNN